MAGKGKLGLMKPHPNQRPLRLCGDNTDECEVHSDVHRTHGTQACQRPADQSGLSVCFALPPPNEVNNETSSLGCSDRSRCYFDHSPVRLNNTTGEHHAQD